LARELAAVRAGTLTQSLAAQALAEAPPRHSPLGGARATPPLARGAGRSLRVRPAARPATRVRRGAHPAARLPGRERRELPGLVASVLAARLENWRGDG